MDEAVVADFEDCEALVHLAAHTPNVPYDTLENCLYWNVNVAVQLVRRASGRDSSCDCCGFMFRIRALRAKI